MNNKLDKILAEISAGELIDKITILEIKKIKINDGEKLKNIEKELSLLNGTLKNAISDTSKIQELSPAGKKRLAPPQQIFPSIGNVGEFLQTNYSKK